MITEQSPSFAQSHLLNAIDGIQHGFFNRHGGVSDNVYSSLNCSYGSHDLTANITENRQRALAAIDLDEYTLYGLNQIHSNTVHTIDCNMPALLRDGDGLVSADDGVVLSVLGADCSPVLFSSLDGDIIGIAHAGWKGAASGIVASVVEKMVTLGALRSQIVACIGPSIQQASYEVKGDFIDTLMQASEFSIDAFIRQQAGRYYFDLPAYITHQCGRADIGEVEHLDHDTYARDEYFSFRRNTHQQLADYGRQISMIARKS